MSLHTDSNSINQARHISSQVLDHCVNIIDNQFGNDYAKRNPQVLTTLIVFYQDVLKKTESK